MAEYGEAKARIFMNQRKEDFLVLNFDDPLVKAYARRTAATVIPFSRLTSLQSRGLRAMRDISRSTGGASLPYRCDPNIKACIISKTPWLPRHLPLLAGADHRSVAAVLREFPGLEHRLEFVRERNGVTFINDSKGTNVGAVVKSVEGFTQPVILIAGGLDKGSDFRPLYDLFRRKVKLLVLIGKAAEKMHRRSARQRRRCSRNAPGCSAARFHAGLTGRRGAPVTGLRELRHVQGLRGPRQAIQGSGEGPVNQDQGSGGAGQA